MQEFCELRGGDEGQDPGGAPSKASSVWRGGEEGCLLDQRWERRGEGERRAADSREQPGGESDMVVEGWAQPVFSQYGCHALCASGPCGGRGLRREGQHAAREQPRVSRTIAQHVGKFGER
eukprot:CAMPEP_0180253914 /NCGR_PEP_ID=MMETSP0987-20121128/39873_1 /TAXON_ID=697907 /ORGANISM="non described non described, Strain CCMP2293" /LENGTH=120 /DNA_ID=CAMNT_0022222851 /DNA_START=15 /DNA_END=374 /DNA_ORIENTATION=+